jgi:hypothetical protein
VEYPPPGTVRAEGTERDGPLQKVDTASSDRYLGRSPRKQVGPGCTGLPPSSEECPRHRPASTGVPGQGALLDNGTEEGQSECGRPRPGPRVGVRALSQINSAPKRTTKKCLVRPVPVGWRQRHPALHDRTHRSPRGHGRDDLDGEFDPGSGRTLAACLIHASRAGLPPVATPGVAERRTGE